MTVTVTGAGGFIGGHLVGRLLCDGHQVRAVDFKRLSDWYQVHPVENRDGVDLSRRDECRSVCYRAAEVYHLAADMGGMGFIESNRAACMLSVLSSTHMLIAARDAGVTRFFFSSSACVYPAAKQIDADVVPLSETDVYPAMPEDGYGWEKLFTERMCRHFYEDFNLETRVARYHNVYGPHGTFEGGREKAPAALCRKIAAAKLTGNHEIEVWGDGEQTRSFMYVADCVEGTVRIMNSDVREPLNLGSDHLVTINELAYLIADIAGITVSLKHNLGAPKGVRGRNSDNTLIRKRLGWEPSVPLRVGLERTYQWIYDQLAAR